MRPTHRHDGAPTVGRLALLYDLVSDVPCERLVDIGSDHATVPIAALTAGICRTALLTDVRPGPLATARRLVSDAGLLDRCAFAQTDGLTGLQLTEDDVVLISGMGGETIAPMLAAPSAMRSRPKRWILQPQTHEEVVRDAMCRLGLPISDERFVVDNDRVYLVIVSDRGDRAVERLTPLERYLGPVTLRRRTAPDAGGDRAARTAYLRKRRRRLEKAAPFDPDARALLEAWPDPASPKV